jgi:hypothetical protein
MAIPPGGGGFELVDVVVEVEVVEVLEVVLEVVVVVLCVVLDVLVDVVELDDDVVVVELDELLDVQAGTGMHTNPAGQEEV